MHFKRLQQFILFLVMLLQSSAYASQGLTLQQAEHLAIQRDAIIKSFKHKAQSYSERAISSEAWPDPKIKFGAQAVPIDSFDLEQEPMTQIVLGYKQMLPRGDSLQYAAESMSAMSRMQQAQSSMREREVLKQVRLAWFDLVFQNESIRIIQANRQLFVKMLDISQSYYASGRRQQQDIVQAELEISLVDDRLEQALSKKIVAIANLAKWVGEENIQDNIVFTDQNLRIKALPLIKRMKSFLLDHPELTVAKESIVSQQNQLDMVDEQYKPQWGFDINYGKRSGDNPDGSERDDFLTTMVTLDLPLFTENKQDRLVSSAKQSLQATRYKQQDVIRLLNKKLDMVNGRLIKLKDRHKLYKEKVLKQAQQNAEVALKGYQSGVVSFFTLTRARITELNTRLSNLQIKIDFNKEYANLQYLIGEQE